MATLAAEYLSEDPVRLLGSMKDAAGRAWGTDAVRVTDTGIGPFAFARSVRVPRAPRWWLLSLAELLDSYARGVVSELKDLTGPLSAEFYRNVLRDARGASDALADARETLIANARGKDDDDQFPASISFPWWRAAGAMVLAHSQVRPTEDAEAKEALQGIGSASGNAFEKVREFASELPNAAGDGILNVARAAFLEGRKAIRSLVGNRYWNGHLYEERRRWPIPGTEMARGEAVGLDLFSPARLKEEIEHTDEYIRALGSAVQKQFVEKWHADEEAGTLPPELARDRNEEHAYHPEFVHSWREFVTRWDLFFQKHTQGMGAWLQNTLNSSWRANVSYREEARGFQAQFAKLGGDAGRDPLKDPKQGGWFPDIDWGVAMMALLGIAAIVVIPRVLPEKK